MSFSRVLLKTVLVGFLFTLTNGLFAKGVVKPAWGWQQISASHVIHHKQSDLSAEPIFTVTDPRELFMLVEQDGYHVTLFDGNKLEPLHRFNSRFSLQGGANYSPSRRFVYFSSPGGWISQYDIYSLKLVAEIRVGINTRNFAVSADGRYVMAANYLPHTLVLLDARDLSPIKLYDVKDIKGKTSRVSAVYTAPPSNSFIAALKDLKLLWEISYADEPPHGFGMWMHDYRVDSGENTVPEPFPVRKITVKDYLDDFYFDEEYVSIVGVSGEGKGQVADMDIGRVIVDDLGIPGTPHPGAGASWEYQGRTLLAVPNLKQGIVSIIDMETWKTIKQVKTSGPGSIIGNHKNSIYLWVDVSSGPNQGVVQVIDKQTFKIVKTLQPVQGKVITHIEFIRNGHDVLLSTRDKSSTVIVYDADTLKEVKRVSMAKP